MPTEIEEMKYETKKNNIMQGIATEQGWMSRMAMNPDKTISTVKTEMRIEQMLQENMQYDKNLLFEVMVPIR